MTTTPPSDFHSIFDPIFNSQNETQSRWPFTDLYDTTTAKQISSVHGKTKHYDPCVQSYISSVHGKTKHTTLL